jgi:hypothetical protein
LPKAKMARCGHFPKALPGTGLSGIRRHSSRHRVPAPRVAVRSPPPPANGAKGRTSNGPGHRRHQKRRPNTRPSAIMSPQHLLATIYHHLGIDPRDTLVEFFSRPVHLLTQGGANSGADLISWPKLAQTKGEIPINQLDLPPSFAFNKFVSVSQPPPSRGQMRHGTVEPPSPNCFRSFSR